MKQNKYTVEFSHHLKSYRMIFLTSILISLFIISSCSINDLGTESHSDQKKIEGSGDLISEEIEVPYFHSISMNTAGLSRLYRGQNKMST